MRTWHLLLLITITVIINLLTIYNIGIGYVAFFFFLQIGLPRIFMMIEKFAANHEQEKSHPFTKFLVAFLHHRFIRSVNYISSLISLTVLVFLSIVISLLQVFLKQDITRFINELFFVHFNTILEIVSYIGYGLFFICLIAVLVDSIRILKKEPIFRL